MAARKECVTAEGTSGPAAAPPEAPADPKPALKSAWWFTAEKELGNDDSRWDRDAPASVKVPVKIAEWIDKRYWVPGIRSDLRSALLEYANQGSFEWLGSRFLQEDGFSTDYDEDFYEVDVINSRGEQIAKLEAQAKDAGVAIDTTQAGEPEVPAEILAPYKEIWDGYGASWAGTGHFKGNASRVMDIFIEDRYAQHCIDIASKLLKLGVDLPMPPQPTYYTLPGNQRAIERIHRYTLWRLLRTRYPHITLKEVMEHDREEGFYWRVSAEGPRLGLSTQRLCEVVGPVSAYWTEEEFATIFDSWQKSWTIEG